VGVRWRAPPHPVVSGVREPAAGHGGEAFRYNV
jgi:hypothetical protein